MIHRLGPSGSGDRGRFGSVRAMPDPAGEPAPDRGGAHTYDGPIAWEYRPELDREADPGEIVWAWVAFEEDARIGKDRPLAVIGRTHDRRLAALMLSSRDRHGHPGWLPIGSGPWDAQGRPSFVRIDRVLAVSVHAVRREGAVLPRQTYDVIAARLGGGARRPGIVARLARVFRRPR